MASNKKQYSHTKGKYAFANLPNYDPWRDAGDEYYYDVDGADQVIRFFKHEVKFTKGKWKGKPFIPSPFQEDILRCLFGFKRVSDNIRRYRKLFLYIPRKNGKSEFIAGISNYIFFCDGENDAEIYVGARDRGQAMTLYTMIESMIRQNPMLEEDVTTYQTTKEIKATWDNSKIQAISSDALSQHSLSPHVGIIDELHAQPNGDLVGALQTGMGAREQPILIQITTADIDRQSVCNEELEFAKAIRDGKIVDPRYLPIIYETPKTSDWESEDTWKIANPNYPETPSRDFMIDMVSGAKSSNRKLSEFCRYNLNMQTSNIEGWLNMDRYHECKRDYSESDLVGQRCWGALDLSTKVDLSCYGLLFESGETILRFYTCQHAVDMDRTGRYRNWVDEGLLTIAGEDRIDYEYIKRDMIRDSARFDVQEWAFDPWNASQTAMQLEREGLHLTEFRQGMVSMNEPAKEFEARIISGSIFFNNEVIHWMAANVAVQEDESGNIKPIKMKRGSVLKVDGIIVMVMCVGLHMVWQEEQRSVYETRGLRVI